MDVKKLCKSNSSTLPDSDPTEMESSPISILPTEMLECIMEMLPLRDQLRCREVNRNWKSAATRPARMKCAPIPLCRITDSDQRIKILSEFNDCVREAKGEFPVSTFHFTWNGCDNRIKFNGRASFVSEFFELVSPFVSELSLDFQLGFYEEGEDKIMKHDYPKLKRLTLGVLGDHSGPDINFLSLEDESLFTFLKGVIQSAPLDNVALIIERDNRILQRNTIQKCLAGTGIRENMKLLTSLKCASDQLDWQNLTIMGLKLKTFIITFTAREAGVDSTVMKAFLESQANTLSSLELEWRIGDHRISMDFPILPQLKHLRIGEDFNYCAEEPEIGLRFPSLSYQSQFPALKKLNLLDTSGSQADLFAQHLAPLDTLEELILPRMWLPRSEIFQVVRLFPNIKKLELSNEYFEEDMQVVYDNLTGIEELRLVNIDVSADFIITGLSKKECEKIREPPSESFNRAVEKLQLPDAKSLACLENLKVLKLHQHKEEEDGWRNVELKEISGYVLKKMKNLKRLDFGVRKFSPFVSKALLDDLEKHGIQVTSQQPPHRRAKLGLLPGGRDDNNNEEEEEEEGNV